MKNRKNKTQKRIVIIFVVSILVLATISWLTFFTHIHNSSSPKHALNQNNQQQSYTSKRLEITFFYPIDWHVVEESNGLTVANYAYNSHSNYIPKNNEREIHINEIMLCSETLDQDIILWGCGEGKQLPNKIIKKTTKKMSSGLFSIYTVLYPQTGKKQNLYYLENRGKVIQLVNNPDLSNFDNEFTKIINSIQFSPERK